MLKKQKKKTKQNSVDHLDIATLNVRVSFVPHTF